MTDRLLEALKLNKGREIKVNYERFKNEYGFEDIFYDKFLVPDLEENNLEHRFNGEFIILKYKGDENGV